MVWVLSINNQQFTHGEYYNDIKLFSTQEKAREELQKQFEKTIKEIRGDEPERELQTTNTLLSYEIYDEYNGNTYEAYVFEEGIN